MPVKSLEHLGRVSVACDPKIPENIANQLNHPYSMINHGSSKSLMVSSTPLSGAMQQETTQIEVVKYLHPAYRWQGIIGLPSATLTHSSEELKIHPLTPSRIEIIQNQLKTRGFDSQIRKEEPVFGNLPARISELMSHWKLLVNDGKSLLEASIRMPFNDYSTQLSYRPIMFTNERILVSENDERMLVFPGSFHKEQQRADDWRLEEDNTNAQAFNIQDPSTFNDMLRRFADFYAAFLESLYGRGDNHSISIDLSLKRS